MANSIFIAFALHQELITAKEDGERVHEANLGSKYSLISLPCFLAIRDLKLTVQHVCSYGDRDLSSRARAMDLLQGEISPFIDISL